MEKNTDLRIGSCKLHGDILGELISFT